MIEYYDSRKKQCHFELPENLWQDFLEAYPRLGYSSEAEFFREKVREAIEKAEAKLTLKEGNRNGEEDR